MNERICEWHLASCKARFFLLRIDKIAPEEVSEAEKILNDEDIQKAKKFVFQKDRNRCLIVYAMVKMVLGEIMLIAPSQVSFLRNPFGKPFLQGHPVHFNWSHSGRYAFFGVHPTQPIGVDIEKVREDITGDAFLHPQEQKLLERFSKSRSEKCCQLWSAKEAYVKALGIGFTQAIPLLEIFNSQIGILYFHAHLSGFPSSIVESYSKIVRGYKLATCLM